MVRLLLVAALVVACHRPDVPATVDDAADFSETHGDIDRYVAAGRTPAAFAELAGSLERARAAGDPRIAADAELRLLALALPLADGARSLPIEAEVERLALTVWPALLGAPLTEQTRGDVTPRIDEGPAAYVARLCAGELADACRGVRPSQRGVAIRAAAMRRAEVRMREALATCLRCGSQSESGWRELAWKWESLDRVAASQLREVVSFETDSLVSF